MSNASNMSSDDIQRDVEQKRSEINETISELKDRLSPEAAADYGVNYLRGPGGQRLLGAVRDNPLAALLVLGGVGWLLYTASQPEAARRRTRTRRGTGYLPSTGAEDELYLQESDLLPYDDDDFDRPATSGSTAAARQPLSGSSAYTGTSSSDRLYGTSSTASHPGMMGDGTEEQNLNQAGDPSARISKDEVEEAFRQDRGSSDLNR